MLKDNDSKKEGRIFYIILTIYLVVCIALYAAKELGRQTVTVEASLLTSAQAVEVISDKILVNINTASLEELMTLDGIGEKTALKIIEYRENNNGFLNVDELIEVSGIGEAKLEKLRDSVTVG